MIEKIKLLLGEAANSYSDAQIQLNYEIAVSEVEAYCNRKMDAELELIAARITVIKLNRLNTEGLASQSYSGINESYIDGYPADILAILKSKRKIRVI